MSVDPRFYQIAKNVTVNKLANHIDAKITGGDAHRVIMGVAPFKTAGDTDLTFQVAQNLSTSAKSSGGIIITTADTAAILGSTATCLIVDRPREAFALALAELVITHGDPGVLANSVVDNTAIIHPHASVAPDVEIGAHTIVEAGAVIHRGVSIGANCHIAANTVLSHCRLGDRVVVGAGTVIGESGFGFEMNEDGVVHIPHVGIVRIGKGSGIGSNCAIDRGSLGDTVIETSVMIDNLCHIAHNVHIGQRVIMTGQCGVSGSVTIGQNVQIGGQVGIAPHVTIGEGAVLTARSGVTKDVPAHMQVAGFPAIEAGLFWRERAATRRLLKPSARVQKT